jgi:hypothetical protein
LARAAIVYSDTELEGTVAQDSAGLSARVNLTVVSGGRILVLNV